MTIGAGVRDPDWEGRTLGAVDYVADVRRPGILSARILRSPHPHARVVSVDTTRAAAMPGVVAVVTGEDLPRLYHHEIPDRFPLARGVVRFVGEEVAAVAARTPEQAEAALRVIDVRYRPLPSLSTVDEALAPGAVRPHQRASGTNVSLRMHRAFGDAEDARAATAVEVTGRYRFGRQTHACMETNGTLASWDPDAGKLDVWTSTQSPILVRNELAEVLGLEAEQVALHEVAVGGGFGSKSKITDHEAVVAALSMKCGRPVRLVLTRDEEFATTKSRHDFTVTLTSGVDDAGRFTFRDARMTVDNGAYNHSGPSVSAAGLGLLATQYRTRSVDIEARLVDTNKNPGGQFRGYGGPQVVFALESQIDELADRLGVDPIDLRITNANEPGDVSHVGWKLGTVGMVECLEAVRKAIDWDEKRKLAGSGRGVGVAVSLHVSGARTYPEANHSEAAIDLADDGRVTVRFGGSDPGTSMRTVIAQVVAQELGLDPERVDVRLMDTETTTFDLGTFSSRGTTMAGLAAKAAAGTAADLLRSLAAEKLHVAPGDVVLAGGSASVGASAGASAGASVGGESVALGDLVAFSGAEGGVLTVADSATVDSDLVDKVTGVANISTAYAFAAQAVEVEVDPETGRVTVLQVVSAHDSGTIVNPRTARGQIIGGVAMGLGAALSEQLLDDHGRMVNPSYLHYALPRAADMPPVTPILIERPDPSGPYGAKSLGEITIVPVAAAVANAVAHATGVRIRELPLTPDKVLAALRPRRRPTRIWRRPGRWWIAGVRAAYPLGLHTVLHRYGTRLARRRPVEPIRAIDRPATVDAAVALLRADRRALPLAGGTDVLPARRQGIVTSGHLVDVTAIAPMREIAEDAGDLVLGGAVTLAALVRSPLTAGDTALRAAVATIASAQIREQATVAGNLCQEKRCWFFRNGFTCYKRGGATCPCYAVEGDHRYYHAVVDAHRCQAVTPSDLSTVLTALDAVARIAGPEGERTLPVGDLYTGPGETALRAGEIIVSVRVPAVARARRTAFRKMGMYHGDFAVASACASVAVDGAGAVGEARVVLGAVAPTPFRARAVERALAGRAVEALETAADAWNDEAHPLRRNGWKIDLANGLLREALGAVGTP